MFSVLLRVLKVILLALIVCVFLCRIPAVQRSVLVGVQRAHFEIPVLATDRIFLWRAKSGQSQVRIFVHTFVQLKMKSMIVSRDVMTQNDPAFSIISEPPLRVR